MKVKYRRRVIISRGLYIFYPIFTAAYIVELLVLQTIYVLKTEMLQNFGLKSAGYNGACTVVPLSQKIDLLRNP